MPLTVSPNPVLVTELSKLSTSSVAHPDSWNPIHQALLDNDAVLHAAEVTNKQTADQAITQLNGRVNAVEATSSVSVQKAVGLDWLYRGNVINFEMFVKGYTLIDLAPVAVVQGVSGDDSLDVADTSGLRVGEFYVLTDPVAVVSALVQVQAILSGVRVRLSANMARTWGATAFIQRSSIKVLGASNAAAVPGDIYLSRSINIGTDAAGGAVVVRRSLNSGLARIYYRDGYQPTWRETGWSLRRTGGDIPAGYADYEYILPMRGDGWLRLDIEGEAMSIAHIVALGTSTGLGGFINPDLRPTTPLISSPAAAAVGVMDRPTLALAAYATPSGNAQDAVQFQLSTTLAFANILHDSGVLAAGLSYPVPAGVLLVNTPYYWRARVRDVAGLWSDYTTVATFTTAASFAYVLAPTITGPAANAVDVPEQPTIATSAFAATAGATDAHTGTQYQIRSANGTYAAPVWDSGEDAVNKLTIVVPAGKLLAGQQAFYLRARHKGSVKGWSEYSPEIKITTKAQFANVIGIALLTTGGGAGQWARVDENGVAKVTDASFFSSHATYGAIQDVLIDGQNMVKIPAFYVKTGTIAAGVNAGKRAWFISDQPAAGYTLHPAFMNAGVPLNQFWVGKYQASSDGSNSKLQSLPNFMPVTGNTIGILKSVATQRNVGGVTGFAMWNIYQLQAIQLLALIDMGGPDSQSLIARGLVDYSAPWAASNTLSDATAWRGIVGLWGNVWQMVDGITTDSGSRLVIWDKLGNKQLINTGVILPGSYPVTFSTASAANFDLGIGFFPATADGALGNGSTGDAFYGSAANNIYLHGGGYNSGTGAGLFCGNLVSAGSESALNDCSTRLAKI